MCHVFVRHEIFNILKHREAKTSQKSASQSSKRKKYMKRSRLILYKDIHIFLMTAHYQFASGAFSIQNQISFGLTQDNGVQAQPT